MANALVWGASGGIGSALVSSLKQRNWTVFGTSRKDDIPDSQADAIFFFDALKPAGAAEVCYNVAQHVEQLDLVIYTIGEIYASPLVKFDEDMWNSILSINLSGALYAINESLNLVSKGGHIMAISAYTEKIMLPRIGAYTVAKSSLETLIKIYSKEHRKINFSLIRPPAVNTPFWENAPFSLPDSALQPSTVAESILDFYDSGNSGELNL